MSGETEELLPWLRRIASFEDQLMHAIPKAVRAANSDRLRTELAHHLLETEGQIDRLSKIAKALGVHDLKGATDERMKRMLADAQQVYARKLEPLEMDRAVIACARPMEQYEQEVYGRAIEIAQKSQPEKIVLLLQESREEEETADRLLAAVDGEIRTGAIHPKPAGPK